MQISILKADKPAKTKKATERESRRSLCLFQHKSKSEPLTRNEYLVRIILTWCGQQDLNLHGCPPVPKTGASAVPPCPHTCIVARRRGFVKGKSARERRWRAAFPARTPSARPFPDRAEKSAKNGR